MPFRTIYEQLSKLRTAISQLSSELPAINLGLTQLQDTFNSLKAAVTQHFEGDNDASNLLEANMARLVAPFNQRLNNSSAS